MPRNENCVEIGDIRIGPGQPLVLIAGPCVIESRDHSLMMAEKIAKVAAKLGMPCFFKSSFDKANRTAIDAYRGPGLTAGLDILQAVKDQVGLPLVTDIHLPEQAGPAAEVVDILQIPAFLCRQTDLLLAAAATGKVVNIKKGQFLAPGDMALPIAKIRSTGNNQVMITERGTCFGYHRLVVDMAGIATLLELGVPVVFDGTHSVQLPGGLGTATGGNRELVAPLCRAAVAVGVDALFLEVHDDPDRGLSDGPNMLTLDQLAKVLTVCRALAATRRP